MPGPLSALQARLTLPLACVQCHTCPRCSNDRCALSALLLLPFLLGFPPWSPSPPPSKLTRPAPSPPPAPPHTTAAVGAVPTVRRLPAVPQQYHCGGGPCPVRVDVQGLGRACWQPGARPPYGARPAGCPAPRPPGPAGLRGGAARAVHARHLGAPGTARRRCARRGPLHGARRPAAGVVPPKRRPPGSPAWPAAAPEPPRPAWLPGGRPGSRPAPLALAGRLGPAPAAAQQHIIITSIMAIKQQQ